MKLYTHKLDTLSFQKKYGFPGYVDNKGVCQQFPIVDEKQFLRDSFKNYSTFVCDSASTSVL